MVLPIRIGFTVPVTGGSPSFTAFKWLAFISTPTIVCVFKFSRHKVPAKLPKDSANATLAPPCKILKG